MEDVHGDKLAELAKEHYVISTSGMPMLGGGRRSQEGQAPQPDFSRMQERMMEVTSLKTKGKESVAPAKIEVLQGKRPRITGASPGWRLQSDPRV
jgi:hypothetical protein